MQYEISNIFGGYTLEVILIAIGAFILTYFIKWPIKRVTRKYEENKRKMINFVIMLIPFVLSFLASVLYHGITTGCYLSLTILDCAFSAYLMSLSLYAIVSRIWLVLKGIWTGKLSINPNLTSEAIKYIKANIKALSYQIKIDEKSLNEIIKKLEKMETMRQILASDTINLDQTKLNEVNQSIYQLMEEQSELLARIEDNQSKTDKYNAELYAQEK